MKIKRLRIYKINEYSLLIFLFWMMPFVDSLSGMLHDRFSIGQIYRILLFFYMIILLVVNSRKRLGQVVIPFLIFLIIQGIVGFADVKKSMQDVIKLFTPILIIQLFEVCIKKGKICGDRILNLVNSWSILYPALILIPAAFGIGGNAYAEAESYKGFFYAVNEISFIMSSLVMFCFWNLKENPGVKKIVILLFNCLCIAIMGTKTGYATIVLFAILYIIFSLNENQKKRKKAILVLGIIIVITLPNISRIAAMTASIIERWKGQRQLSYSTIDFLFSMRLRRFGDAWKIFAKDGNFIFGCGFDGSLIGQNMEMDFLDLMFRTGIFGVIYIILFYVRKVLKQCHRNKFLFFILIWSFALSFGAGHVLFYGQSGMMLAINIICVEVLNQKQGLQNSGRMRKY